MGLTGPAAVLPEFYTEYLMSRRGEGDETAVAFFDLFNHRLISLFYLAWEKYHFPIAYERDPAAATSSRGFSQYLFDLIGMGTPGLRGRPEVNDAALLYYSGLIAQRPHSAAGLEGILRDFFHVPVEIVQFIGKWHRLEKENLSYLDGQGDYGLLGEGAIAGDQVWNQQASFRVRIGPLDWQRLNQFLPGTDAFRKLVSFVRYYVNRTWDFDVQLMLLLDEVKPCSLWDDRVSRQEDPPRLGLSSWLKTAPFIQDAMDTVITVPACGAQ